ncbi:MAG TPA: ABC transporter ATP-binding protein/permease [Bdellovibrionales bacterium]|nr:ABC transporter ATP-binding protein/permease [Bdellovibrionales bacterium]
MAFDASAESPNRGSWKTLKTLGFYLWPRGYPGLKMRVAAAVFCLLLAKIVGVYVPFLLKQAVDALSVEAALLAIPLGLILAYGAARFLQQAFGELRDYLFVNVSQHAQRQIALSTFKHLHNLSMRFHLERQTGGLSRVIERGVKGIQFVLSFMLFNIVPTIFEIILVTGILLVQFDLSFAAITFFTIAFYIGFTLIVTDWRLKYRVAMNKRDTEANTKAIDSLLNYETVKYFGNEEHEHGRYDQALKGYMAAATQGQASLSLLNVGQATIIAAGLLGVMWLAARGVVHRSLTVGDFVLVNTFLIQLYLPLNFLGFVYRETKQGLVDMDKMFELLQVNAEIEDKPGARALTVTNGEIEFDAVTFGYEPDRVILRDVSFNVPAGKTVALVGPSGSGKSTISRLLFRFYDIQRGAIRIDGQDIRDATQKSVRAAIGIVPQDTVLFNDTIIYNIHYGRVGATEDEVVQAARMAHIHDFVASLPQGYKTTVGERGLKLSGGEKQRVAIARAILKKPRILVFDEATSALDSRTEKEIQRSLNEVARDRTTLVIAHRLSTVVDADQILVLKNGQIVERGRHQELLRLGGEYAAMWEKQQQQIQAAQAAPPP